MNPVRPGSGSAAVAAHDASAHVAGYTRGVVLVLLGGTALSLGGLMLRNIEQADGWQIMFYRAIAFTLTIFVFLVLRYRGAVFGAFRAVGKTGIAVAFTLGIGSIGYLFALIHTTVANALFLISSSPFIAAIGGWLLLGERVAGVTWIAIGAALLGVGIMMVDGFATGLVFGNTLAFFVGVSMALMIILLRRGRAVDMLPSVCLAGVIAAGISGFMVTDFTLTPRDLVLALAMGTVQFALGFILITLGTRTVPAAEVSLLALSETILAPIWVWVFVGEVPTATSLAGGLIVVTAIVSQALVNLQRARAQRRMSR